MTRLSSGVRSAVLHARLLAVVPVVLTSIVVTPTAASADPVPPGGRANYVVALMRNVGTESFVRLAEYSLRADGTARADYWAWNAKTLQSRADTGFDTGGCANTCTVWTTNGFQYGPKQLYGTWSVSGTDLSISWTTNSQTERWKFVNLTTVTRLDLASHPTATDGFGWGSTVGFRTGVSVPDIYAAHGTYSGPGIENNYGETTYKTHTQVVHHPDSVNPVRLCSSTCMNLSTVTNKVYLAGTGLDRKMYYNHQKYEVNSHPCIGGGSSVGAGHLKPALQIIDDTGKFRGLVVVEASLYAFKNGSNIMGIFDLNDI